MCCPARFRGAQIARLADAWASAMVRVIAVPLASLGRSLALGQPAAEKAVKAVSGNYPFAAFFSYPAPKLPVLACPYLL